MEVTQLYSNNNNILIPVNLAAVVNQSTVSPVSNWALSDKECPPDRINVTSIDKPNGQIDSHKN